MHTLFSRRATFQFALVLLALQVASCADRSRNNDRHADPDQSGASEVAAVTHARQLGGLPRQPAITLATFFGEILPGLRSITEDFHRETGIRLKVQGIPYQAYGMWLRTQFLGREPPEVLLIEGTGGPTQYGQAGLVVSFDEVIKAPNPLDSQPRSWADYYRPSLIQQARDASGHLWCLPYTMYGVGFFYNKDIYARAGLEPPSTWQQLVENCQTLVDQGLMALMTAVKPKDAQTMWMTSLLIECLMRRHIPEVNLRHAHGWRFDPQDRRCTLDERIDLTERIVAFERGIIDPARSPEAAEVVRLMLEFSKTWRPDFLSAAGDEIYGVFARGQTAHFMNGTWFIPPLRDTQRLMSQVAPENVFDYDTFPFPRLTRASTSLATGEGINQNAGMRACLIVPDQPLASWKARAGMLLCHYLTLPRVARKVFNNMDVYDLPALTDVAPKPEATKLLPRSDYAYLPLMDLAGYDAQAGSEFWPDWQMVLGGKISSEEFLERRSIAQRESLVRLSRVYAEDLDHGFIMDKLGRPFP